MSCEIRFEKLPLWKGVQNKPGIYDCYPFSLGWDPRGLICQTTPADIREEVILAYSSGDYNFITQPPGFSEWADRLGDSYADFIVKTCGDLKGKKVLEIGAASQYLAKKLISTAGVSEYWIFDPAIKGSALLPNIHIRQEYFDANTRPDKRFDLVISLNCLEHVPDPMAFLFAIRESLEPGSGKVVLVFPDNEKQFREGDINAILHEHLTYYTSQICKELFLTTGFRVLESCTNNDTFSFLIEPAGKPVQAFFPEDTILATADQRFRDNLACMSQTLRQCLAKGEKVALHGATNGLNNALVLTGLAEQKKLLIFDGDRAKEGKYLPVLPVPIRHSGDPGYGAAEQVFVAALTYYDEIRCYLWEHHRIPHSRIHPLFPMQGVKK